MCIITNANSVYAYMRRRKAVDSIYNEKARESHVRISFQNTLLSHKTQAHRHAHTETHAPTPPLKHPDININIVIYTYTNIYTHTHSHTHTQTHT